MRIQFHVEDYTRCDLVGYSGINMSGKKTAVRIFPGRSIRGKQVDIDVVGIATDYCVRASALDAIDGGWRVRVITDLVAGVALASSAAALEELEAAGAELAVVR